MTSEPTKEAMEILATMTNVVRYEINGVPCHVCATRARGTWYEAAEDAKSFALAIDAHTAALRERLRLAVEARKAYRDAWVRQQSTDCEPIGIVPEVRAPSVGAELADSALRAAGVEI